MSGEENLCKLRSADISVSLHAMEGTRGTDQVKDQQYFRTGCAGHSGLGLFADEDNIT